MVNTAPALFDTQRASDCSCPKKKKDLEKLVDFLLCSGFFGGLLWNG